MGQKPSLAYSIHECLCNNNREKLAELMSLPEFGPSCIDDRMFVVLIERQWDVKTVMDFAKKANDDQLAITIAMVIMHVHVLPIEPLFKLMKDVDATVARHHLKQHFVGAVDHDDVDGVRTLIAFKCFEAEDPRPLVTAVRREMNRQGGRTEVVELLLEVQPNLTEAAQYLLDECLPHAKAPAIREKLQKMLQTYVNER